MYGSFTIFDGLQHESSLNVVEDSEVLLGLWDINDVHESDWESPISSDLVVDEDTSLLVVQDHSDFSAVHGIFESVLEDDGKG